MGTETDRFHPVRGVLVAAVAGPVFVAAAVVAVTGMLSTLVAGWVPSSWWSSNVADWVFGGGVAGDASNYARVVGGGMVAAAAATALRWGFVGDGGGPP